MNKRFLLASILLLLLLPVELWAGDCTGSSPTWTTTPDWTSVDACVDGASAGDTINVTAGDGAEEWGQLTFTQEIHLIGPGKDNLTITGSSSPMIHFMPSTCVSGGPEIEVSGFTFNNGNARAIIQLFEEGAAYPDNNLCYNANIHENAFAGTTTANSTNYYIELAGMGGVVWKNTFVGAWQSFVGHHQVTTADPDNIVFEAYDPELNTAKALYFEDNVITKVGTSDDYAQDCQFGGLQVIWRYNTWNIPNSPQCIMDWHGWVNDGYVSCQGYLFYGNQFNMNNNTGASLTCNRGGKSVHYFNNFTTTNSGVSMGDVWSESATGTGCPTTYLDDQIHQDYQWNNRRNLTTAISGWSQNDTCTCDGVSDYPAPDNNYFNYVYSGYDGSTGMGCGTLANRPADPSLDRTGYWATDGTCSTTENYVGDILTNPSRQDIPDGTLYVWDDTSSEWETYYTPYTYPHPLRGEGEEPSCDAEHLSLCLTQETCEGASGYWWGDQCNEGAEPPPATISGCTVSGVTIQ